MLSIKLYVFVLFIFISLYYSMNKSASMNKNALNTAGSQKAVNKLKQRSYLATLVSDRA